MAQKFVKYTIKGVRTLEAAQTTVGHAAPNGQVVRIDQMKGETHVFVAVDEAQPTGRAAKAAAKASAKGGGRVPRAVEVTLDEVLRIGRA